MSFGTKYSKSKPKFNFQFEDGKKYDFKKVAEISDNPYIIRLLYTTDKGKYGEQAVAVVEGSGSIICVNLPKHLLDEVKEMLKDHEAIDAINAGKAGIQRYCYDEEKKFYSVNWIDI